MSLSLKINRIHTHKATEPEDMMNIVLLLLLLLLLFKLKVKGIYS